MGSETMEMRGRVVVFSIVGCPHCLRAKNRLSELGIPYNDISLDSYPQMREEVKRLTGGKITVPQIFFNEIYVGGNDELQKLVKNKAKFGDLVEKVKNEESPPEAPQLPDPATAIDHDKNSEFVCEPDEYYLLARDIRKSGIIKEHRTGVLKTHKSKSFKGQDLLDWLTKEKNFDKPRALEIAENLLGRNFGKLVEQKLDEGFNPDRLYQLLDDDDTHALNSGALSECLPLKASDLGEQLRRLILKVYSDGLSKDGKAVDYKKISKDPEFEKYCTLSKELQRVDVESSSREERLAFFINIYNALVIHGNVKMGHPANIWQRYKFFNTVRYIIGGQAYSLQDIENGVLRGNRKGVGMFRKPFGPTDPRLKIALDEAEPLIHFALNCGAKSCPPIKTFTAKGVDAELKVAAEAFLETEDALMINLEKREIAITQIFKWYQEDFGGTKEKTLEWILARMTQSEQKDKLAAFVNAGYKGAYNIKYLPYDWGHNSKE